MIGLTLGMNTQRARGAPSAPAGYDIILQGGQSNMMHGASFNAGLDISDSRIYQFYYGGAGTANTVSPAGANDPLDQASGVDTGNIGHTVHLLKDYYIANGVLQSPRKLLIVPNAYGGSSIANAWRVNPGAGNSTPIGTMVSELVTRANLAKALTGTNTIKMLDWHQGEGDFYAYTTFQAGLLVKYRWGLYSLMKYLRTQIGSTFPIVLGRMSDWTINTGDGGTTYLKANTFEADKIVRALARKLPNVGIADSLSPTVLGSADVHFTAAEQRLFAGRYWTGYQAASTNSAFPTSPTWDDIDYQTTAAGYPSGFAISNAALDLSGDAGSGWKATMATMPSYKNTDKLYWEMKVQSISGDVGICGISNHEIDTTTNLGGSGNSGKDAASAGAWANNGSLISAIGSSGWTLRTAASFGTNSVNDRYMFALDRSTGKCWVGKNGTWVNSGNPSAGTNEWVNGIPQTDSVFIAASIYQGTSNTWRIQARAGEFAYTVPSGFTPWGSGTPSSIPENAIYDMQAQVITDSAASIITTAI